MTQSAKASMPRHVVPMLATAGALPTDDGWAHEIKWDGVRALTYVEGGALHMESRNLRDISPRYPELYDLPTGLVGHDAIVDGEVVAFDERGVPSFERLQQRMHLADANEVRRRMATVPVVYAVFDILWLDGRSLLAESYAERRKVLESMGLERKGTWHVPSSHVGDGQALLDAASATGLEGVVSKRLTSTYEPGRRSTAWRKVKIQRRQEMVIGGWLPGGGNRSGRIGALLIGYYRDGDLYAAGRVGTGFSDKTLRELAELLAPLERSDSPFVVPPRERAARWVEPVLVCEVEFTEWTVAGTLRHPSFKGLRDDKPAIEVVREPVLGEH